MDAWLPLTAGATLLYLGAEWFNIFNVLLCLGAAGLASPVRGNRATAP